MSPGKLTGKFRNAVPGAQNLPRGIASRGQFCNFTTFGLDCEENFGWYQQDQPKFMEKKEDNYRRALSDAGALLHRDRNLLDDFEAEAFKCRNVHRCIR